MSLKNQDLAVREVRAFLDRHSAGLHQNAPDWLVPRALASTISVRLLAAVITSDEQRRKQHEDSAASKLAELIKDASRNLAAFYACGELFELLMDEGLPIPDELGRFAKSVITGDRAPPRKPGRKASLGRDSIIFECVLIAAQYDLPLYSSASRPTTAVEVVSWCLPDYGVNLDSAGIARIWKMDQSYRKAVATNKKSHAAKGTN